MGDCKVLGIVIFPSNVPLIMLRLRYLEYNKSLNALFLQNVSRYLVILREQANSDLPMQNLLKAGL